MIYEIFAPGLASLFIKNEVTVKYAAAFLRRMVLAMPLMSLCYPLIIKFQAMGKGKRIDNGFDSSQGSSRYSALFHDGCTVSAVRLHVGSADC